MWTPPRLWPKTKRCVGISLSETRLSFDCEWCTWPRLTVVGPLAPFLPALFPTHPHWISTNNQCYRYSRLSETVSSQSSVPDSVPSKNTVSSNPTSTKSIGNDGVHMSAKGSGVPSERTIRRMAMPGIRFRLRWHSQELIGGVKMEWRVFRELCLYRFRPA